MYGASLRRSSTFCDVGKSLTMSTGGASFAVPFSAGASFAVPFSAGASFGAPFSAGASFAGPFNSGARIFDITSAFCLMMPG